jgi:hypothetical protein
MQMVQVTRSTYIPPRITEGSAATPLTQKLRNLIDAIKNTIYHFFHSIYLWLFNKREPVQVATTMVPPIAAQVAPIALPIIEEKPPVPSVESTRPAAQSIPAPIFVPYKIKIEKLPNGTRCFDLETPEQEGKVMEELQWIVRNAPRHLQILDGLHKQNFVDMIGSFDPHPKRIRELFKQHFELYEREGSNIVAIGPKIRQQEDLGLGRTQITYQDGRIKVVAQNFLEARHPWARQELEKDIEISPQMTKALQESMPHVLAPSNNHPEIIRWFDGVNDIFELPSVPGIVFKKCSSDKDTKERYENMVKAQFFCMALGLNRLVVPHARLVEVEHQGQKYCFIAEERLNFAPEENGQEDLYQKHSHELDEIVDQMIQFIKHTQLTDISWRNIPLLEGPVLKIALIDLDQMDCSILTGLVGRSRQKNDRGLLGCLFSKKQIATVADAAHPYDEDDRLKAAIALRLKELHADRKLYKLYAKTGILQDPRRLIPIEKWTEADWQKLGLDLNEQDELILRDNERDYYEQTEKKWCNPISLKEAVIDIVQEINQGIREASENFPVKHIRLARFNMNHFKNYQFETDDKIRGFRWSRIRDYNDYMGSAEKGRWLPRIIEALLKANCLLKFEKDETRDEFLLQA